MPKSPYLLTFFGKSGIMVMDKYAERGIMEARSVGREIKKCNNLLKRSILRLDAIRESDVMTGMHGYMLGYLYENRSRDVFQRDIENEFSIRRSTVTDILQRMENNGLISREGVSSDKRLKKIVLTEKAIALHRKTSQALQAFDERLKQGIAPQELEDFFVTLDKIMQNIEASGS